MASVINPQWSSAFESFLKPARYKGGKGGRGSGKSHHFAQSLVVKCATESRTRAVCIREVQKSLKESAKRLIEDKINFLEASGFKIKNDEIVTPGDGIIIFEGMQDFTAESIKSLEGFDVAWVEEAHTLSQTSLEMLRPTIRADDSEIWASWNPRNPEDPIDKFLCSENPPESLVLCHVNWDQNPWFSKVLEEERQHDLHFNSHRYAHIWEGEYEPMVKGAIWTRDNLRQYRRDKSPSLSRIVVGVDPAVTDTEVSDTHGIGVAALGEDNRGYVLEDGSRKGSPRDWAERVISLYDKWEADAVVIEVNQGGDMVRHTLQAYRRDIRIIEVRATRGKHVRAEPISALYNLGQISHIGTHQELEDQLCKFTSHGYEGSDSPDRAEAMIWAFSELFPRLTRNPGQDKQSMSYQLQTEGAWMG